MSIVCELAELDQALLLLSQLACDAMCSHSKHELLVPERAVQ